MATIVDHQVAVPSRWQDLNVRSLLARPGADLSYDDLVGLYAISPDVSPRGQWVRAIFVSSTDGAAQGPDHRAGALSSENDQRIFALQRSLSDLVLVGAGTARVEGYRPVQRSEVDADLRTRLGLAPVPAIAVVSRSLTLEPGLLLGGEAPTLVVTAESAASDAIAATAEMAQVIVTGSTEVDIPAALDRLLGLGYRRVLCEGGPSLLAQVVAAGRLDDLCLATAPLLVGGDLRRILHGPRLDPPHRLRLADLLEHDGELFARYLVDNGA
jgi:riboflavin biosynthesis pyrimidine reductase